MLQSARGARRGGELLCPAAVSIVTVCNNSETKERPSHRPTSRVTIRPQKDQAQIRQTRAEKQQQQQQGVPAEARILSSSTLVVCMNC